MSRTRPLIATVVLAALGGVVLAPPATAAPPVLEEQTVFEVPSPRATGYDVDLDGDLAVYTGRYQASSAAGTGLVQVARWAEDASGARWVTTDLPVPADARGYGTSVAVDEESGRVAVGAVTSQQVVVYARVAADEWQVDEVLTAPAHPRVGTVRAFGESIALDGDTLVVGAPNSTVDGRANAGVAYAFRLDAGAGSPLVPDADEVVADAIAGQSVAVADGTIAVGAPQVRRTLDYYGGRYRVGGVYVWDAADLAAGPSLTSQPVSEAARSVPPSTGGGPAFGYGLAIVGDRLYVGSPLEVNYTADDPDDPLGGYNTSSVDEGTTTQGAVYVYDVTDPASPAQVGGKLMPPAHTWEFGHAIDATEDALLASGHHSADQQLGQVYVLDPGAVDPATPDDGGLLRQTVAPTQALRGAGMQPGARFGGNALGTGMAVSGQHAAIAGFPTGTVTSGRVFMFAAASPIEVIVPDATLTYGEPAVVTATVTGPVPARATATLNGVDIQPGTSNFDALTLHPTELTVGTHILTVDIRSEDGAVLATGTGALTVNPAATTTVINSADRTQPIGPRAALTLRGSVRTPFNTPASGSVELVVDGATLATADVGPDGAFSADITAPSTGAQRFTIEARYSGDANHAASVGTATVDLLQPTAPEGPDPVPPAAQAPDLEQGSTAYADTYEPAQRAGPLAITGPGAVAALGTAAAALAGVGVVSVLRARRARSEGSKA